MQHDLARVLCEVLEEHPFGPAHRDDLGPVPDEASFDVDLVTADPHDPAARGAGRVCPPEDRSHARGELIGMEGLRDVVVRTQVEAARLVRRGAQAGQQDDRYLA